VKFAYYKRLGPRERRIYDQSDALTSVRLPAGAELQAWSAHVANALAADDRGATEAAAQRLVDGVLGRLHVPPVEVRVLAVRPSTSRQELHGLYEYGGQRARPQVTVWMRTVQKRQVVAFRTFLRTLLHEVVHHLDYQMLRLADSYHTQGFYKRAESLYRQLVTPELAAAAAAAAPRAPGRARRRDAAPTPALAVGAAPRPRRPRPPSTPAPAPQQPLPASPSRRLPPPSPGAPASPPARPRRAPAPPPQPTLFDLG
jgi:hypothetical protein